MPIRSRRGYAGRFPAALVLWLVSGGLDGRAGAYAFEPPPATRQDEWERLRQQKLTELRAETPGFLEGRILAIEKAERPSFLQLNLGGIYPRAQSIGWGSQVAVGARFWQPDIGSSRFDVHASAFYSLRHYESYELQAGFLPHRGRALPPRPSRPDDAFDFGNVLHRGQRSLLGYTSLRYHHLPEVDYYGLGNNTSVDDHTTFLQQDAWYDLVLSYAFTERVIFLLRGGLIQFSVGPGQDEDFPTTQEVFDDADTPGLGSQPDFLHVTGVFVLDGRDAPGNPHTGGLLALSAGRYDDRDGDAYDFHRVAADARAFLPLGSRQRVLAVAGDGLRGHPGLREPRAVLPAGDAGRQPHAPGIPNFRFRGERLLLLQAEYRWEAAPAIELAAFVDAGNVLLPRVRLERSTTSTRLGPRAPPQDATTRVRLRFDVARSPEDTRLPVPLRPGVLAFTAPPSCPWPGALRRRGPALPAAPLPSRRPGGQGQRPAARAQAGGRGAEHGLRRARADLSRAGRTGSIPPAVNVNTLGEVPGLELVHEPHGRPGHDHRGDGARSATSATGPDMTRPLDGHPRASRAGSRRASRCRTRGATSTSSSPTRSRYPNLSTAADVIGSRFFHALGYFVPENHVAYVRRDQLTSPRTPASRCPGSGRRKMTEADLDRILANACAAARTARIRVVASRRAGRRGRRPARIPRHPAATTPTTSSPTSTAGSCAGCRVFSAWLNHDDSRRREHA